MKNTIIKHFLLIIILMFYNKLKAFPSNYKFIILLILKKTNQIQIDIK